MDMVYKSAILKLMAQQHLRNDQYIAYRVEYILARVFRAGRRHAKRWMLPEDLVVIP